MAAPTKVWRNKEYRKKVFDIVVPGQEILFFDTETTGLSPKSNHIIEIAAIKYSISSSFMLEEVGRLHRYIRPPYMISQEIIDLTGITNEQLADAPYEEDCIEEIIDFFGCGPLIVAGHNVGFDTRFLQAMYNRNGYPWISDYTELDTLEMAKDTIPPDTTENYKLGTLAHVLGIDEGVKFHSAIEDIQVTAKLFQVCYWEYHAQIADEEIKGESVKEKPDVKAINFWEGYRGFSRIYVETTAGSLYFDVRRKVWAPKDVDMDALDVDHIERECLSVTGCADTTEFARFKGRIKL